MWPEIRSSSNFINDDTYSFKRGGRVAPTSSKAPALLVSPSYTSFMKFDVAGLPALGVSPNNIRSARLRFYVLKTAARPANLNLYRVTSPWEEVLTGSTNQPQFDPIAAPLAQVAVMRDKSFVYADVTSLVQNWMTSGNNHGIAITAQSLVRLGSKEGSATGYPAELEIEVDTTFPLLTLNGGIDGSLIEAGTVGSSQLGAGVVTGNHLSSGIITGSHLSQGLITGAHIPAGTITGTHLSPGTIQGNCIGDGQIGGSKLMDDSVEFSKLRPRTFANGTGAVGQMVQSNSLTTPLLGAAGRALVQDDQNNTLTVTLTTNGGPVFIGLQGDAVATSHGLVTLVTSMNLEFERERIDVPVAPAVIYQAKTGTSLVLGDAARVGVPPSSFWLVDGMDSAHPLPAGTYTYKVYVGPNTNCAVKMSSVKIVAYEF